MTAVYLVFALLAPAIFWLLPVRPAILVVFFGGWLLLPVADYPTIEPSVAFPWWITGLALPGEMLIAKSWVAPGAALVGALFFDFGALRQLRLSWIDVPMAAWCLWPLAGGMIPDSGFSPAPVISTFYLLGSWGTSWCLGRIWFADSDSQLMLLKACALSGVACLPFALAEGLQNISFYQMLYGTHPYAMDGLERYLGHRPVGFFEHGNQYGLWVSTAALAAIWLTVAGWRSACAITVLFMTVPIAFMAQSVGALLLCAVSLALMVLWRRRIVWPLFLTGMVCIALAVALHVSGLLPLRWIARETEIGQTILSTLRSLGRGSFTWRISQDLKTMNLVDGNWLAGKMDWDWWRRAGTRPWGMWLLLIGQFGLIGFVLAYGTVFYTATRVLAHLRHAQIWSPAAASMPLALIVLMALADSMLNAFLYFPAIMAAGALAGWRPPAIDQNMPA